MEVEERGGNGKKRKWRVGGLLLRYVDGKVERGNRERERREEGGRSLNLQLAFTEAVNVMPEQTYCLSHRFQNRLILWPQNLRRTAHTYTFKLFADSCVTDFPYLLKTWILLAFECVSCSISLKIVGEYFSHKIVVARQCDNWQSEV